MKQKITAAIILLISLVGAILIGNWEYKYYPRNRVDIIHPYSNNRAFTRAYGFVDQSIVLCAADWPYTFFRLYCSVTFIQRVIQLMLYTGAKMAQ